VGARAVGLSNDQEVVAADSQSTDDFNLEAYARVIGVVDTHRLMSLFAGTM
jgi:hypothetical protein